MTLFNHKVGFQGTSNQIHTNQKYANPLKANISLISGMTSQNKVDARYKRCGPQTITLLDKVYKTCHPTKIGK